MRLRHFVRAVIHGLDLLFLSPFLKLDALLQNKCIYISISLVRGSSSSVYRCCQLGLHIVNKHLGFWPQHLTMGISAWGWRAWSPCTDPDRMHSLLFKSFHKSGAFSQLFPTKYPTPFTSPETILKAEHQLKLSLFNLFCYKPTKQLIRGTPSASPLLLPSSSEG